jgi:hypothetical protein
LSLVLSKAIFKNTLLIFKYTVQSETHHDKSLWYTYHTSWWYGYIFCSIEYIFKISLVYSVTCYHPKYPRKWLNRLGRARKITVSLRRVICILHWFITLCLWLYCKNINNSRYSYVYKIFPFMLAFYPSLTLL